MNSIYVQHSRSVNGNIDEIIHTLNKLVIQYSVPQIFNEIESNKPDPVIKSFFEKAKKFWRNS